METSSNNTQSRQSGGEERSHAGRQQLINGIQSSYIISLIGGVGNSPLSATSYRIAATNQKKQLKSKSKSKLA
jgi:hypothetical protein